MDRETPFRVFAIRQKPFQPLSLSNPHPASPSAATQAGSSLPVAAGLLGGRSAGVGARSPARVAGLHPSDSGEPLVRMDVSRDVNFLYIAFPAAQPLCCRPFGL